MLLIPTYVPTDNSDCHPVHSVRMYESADFQTGVDGVVESSAFLCPGRFLRKTFIESAPEESNHSESSHEFGAKFCFLLTEIGTN